MRTYLPTVELDAGPVSQDGDVPSERLGLSESLMMKLIINALEQGRRDMVMDSTLMRAAHDKATRMAREGWQGHVDPSGEGPNDLLRRFGYELPEWYSTEPGANSVESLSYGGYGTCSETFNGWMNSPSHRVHVMGGNKFFAHQRAYGIAYVMLVDSPKTHYWVFLSAPVPGEPY